MTPELQGFKSAVEQALHSYLPSQSPIAQSLVDAMRHAALGGGKRLRPLLTCAACTTLGGRLQDALAPACAVEFIHAYSLIHDDLPAMDDDALRRGQPSCHVAYGEATAILAGDALQALAFQTLSQAPGAAPEVRASAVGLLAEACGWGGLVGGQCFDLASEGESLTLDQLRTLHAAKTGTLIRVAVQLGSLFGAADAASHARVERFASRIGLAFQVIDDVLDVSQPTGKLGKPAGSDERAGKSTFPALMGTAPAREYATVLLQEALEDLEQAGLAHGPLADLGRLAVERDF